ncbi:hypothetical protein CRE_08917 [Caenorhabditis remanei]|uniref:G-protein coupled receptors family 1 profile domain-containing protein n=1 Tax=Caenorhabditis remanei TaxID=31234 RepID=E3LIA1_CAERE|nr:hypothetical protein CRE_08917 [Caenorhabditis remanei]
MASFNWTEIRDTCPEFTLSSSDFLLALVALVGFVMNFKLQRRFFKQLKGSVFLINLAACDTGICFIYIWKYFLPSIVMYLQSDILGEMRIIFSFQAEIFNIFYDTAMNLLILYIVIEKLLWTCRPRTRRFWRLFTSADYKFYLAVGTVCLSLIAAVFVAWRLDSFSESPFCDLQFSLVKFENPYLQFLQSNFLRTIYTSASLLTITFVGIALCRVSKVGEGENPMAEEDISLSAYFELTVEYTKRSIHCMLFVAMTFFARDMFWYFVFNPSSEERHKESMHSRILRNWTLDFMNVILSGSRMVFYYLFCGKRMVLEFQPNGVRNDFFLEL